MAIKTNLEFNTEILLIPGQKEIYRRDFSVFFLLSPEGVTDKLQPIYYTSPSPINLCVFGRSY